MKSYKSYYNDIKPDELFEGLVAFGLFADKLPPVFTGESFYRYARRKNPGFPKKDFGYIKYENTRNINVPRLLAIPHPIAYYNLVEVIHDNWSEVKSHIASQTNIQFHKVSKIHLRKRKGTKSLFKMNYKTYEDESVQDVDLVIGKRYKVSADISNCYPSIYSHSIPWALMGKEEAKSKSKDSSLWQNKLDFYLRNTKNQETNGILIGPHTSNLIAELILITVDNNLHRANYKFTRHIDDYTCYAPTKEKAERFLIDLSQELKKFELTLNHKKSEISQLPHAFTSHWVRKLKQHRFSYYRGKDGKKYVPTGEVERYLDLAVELMHAKNDNSAILNYAFKLLSKKKLDSWAVRYLIKRAHHLCFIYPYLIQILDEVLFTAFEVAKKDIKAISDELYGLGLSQLSYEPCSYSLFFALKYNFKISGSGTVRQNALESEDCVFMTLAYLYNKKHDNSIKEFRTKAKALYSCEPDPYWLFIYEVLGDSDLTDSFKAMKKNKVSFVKSEYS